LSFYKKERKEGMDLIVLAFTLLLRRWTLGSESLAK
jgi:hypothetical protein